MKIIGNIQSINNLKSYFIKIKEKIKEKNNRIKNKEEKRTELKYYALLFSMVLVGIFSLILNIKSSTNIDKENYSTYSLESNREEKINNNNLVEVNSIAKSVETGEYKQAISSIYTNIPNKVEEENIKTNKETKKYIYEYSYIMPIKGEIIRKFSIDKVVYLKTIDMWKIHEGIDIKANIGDKVVAVEKGTVKNIVETEFYGITIEIDHGNSYTSKYSNLNKDVKVKIGDMLQKGQEIGIIGNSAKGEYEDESHLHFEIMKNGQYIDPEILGIK